jgi:hypothetical protein
MERMVWGRETPRSGRIDPIRSELTEAGSQFENRRATGLMQSMIAQVIPSGRRH